MNQEIKKNIGEVQEEIGKLKDNARIKFVERNNLHLSLKFLGNLCPPEIQKTSVVLQTIVSQQLSFMISLSGNIGIFPNPKNPRVIWIGLERGNNEIAKIYHQIEQKLMKENFYRKDKSFSAHITLGRIKYITDKNGFIESLNRIQGLSISQKVYSFELMESHLTPEGPIYKVINSFQFL